MTETPEREDTATRRAARRTPPHPGGGVRRGRMTRDPREGVSAQLSRDQRISYSARGLWVAIASYPDGTAITLDMLAAGKDGRHAVRTALNELITHGYLTRGDRARNELGQLGPYQYLLTDQPDLEPAD